MPEIYDYEPLFDGWTVEEKIGSGGFGEVYMIHKTEFGITQHAAVKRISIPNDKLVKFPKLLDMVQTEIQTMISLKSAPHIVKIEGFAVKDWKGRDKGKDILIRMELLDSLEKTIENKTLPADEVLKTGLHICRMLELCEKRNIIHRDIKPANIFVSEFGDYKLGDFGIARTLTDGMASTRTGTGDFMAPEVFYGGKKYDLRADIYSLGVTLYYLLNDNMMPFEREDRDHCLLRRMDGEALPRLKDVPDRLAQIVLKACSHKPDDRYNSPSEMREALEAAGKPADKAAAPSYSSDIFDPNASIGFSPAAAKGRLEEYVAVLKKALKNGSDRGKEAFIDIKNKIGYEKAIEALHKVAERGDASAHYKLGVMYYNGKGVSQDYAQALLWYRKSAEQEHANAQYNLGVMYDTGKGVTQDKTQAAAWYRKAAAQGHAEAEKELRRLGG